jgi:23S rRNA (uracil1939-C5)-methyltransferase
MFSVYSGRMSSVPLPKGSSEGFSLDIDEVAFGGAGLGRRDGKVVFVPYTIDGERVAVRVIAEHRGHSQARLEVVERASPQRCQPVCPYFGKCGGCDYQHMSYNHQLEIKQQQVRQILTRLGGLSELNIEPIISSPKAFSFRNRITVHQNDHAIGYFARNSRTVIDVVSCPIASPAVNEKLKALRTDRRYDRHHYTLREHAEQLTFAQTNDFVAPMLRDYVVSEASGQLAVDGFSGDGFFAHALAPHFARVVGIEWNRPAVEQARRAALANETYVLADVSSALPELLASNLPDTLVLDPSRTGLNATILEAILAQLPPRVIYVSCNPPVLARDLKALKSSYVVQEVQPFDMFPQSAEIEVVAILDRI